MKHTKQTQRGIWQTALLTAAVMTATPILSLAAVPVTSTDSNPPGTNESKAEAPAPDYNHSLTPEFAYSQDKWAALKDDVMEYGELADLIHEYNPTVRSNRESYNDMKGKDLNDIYDEMMDIAQQYWDRAADSDDDISEASANASGNQQAKSADDLYQDAEMEKLTYDKVEAGLVKQAQGLMADYQMSAYTIQNQQNAKTILEDQYRIAQVQQSLQMATATDVLNALKSVQDQDAAILSAQKTAENTHRSLCLMLGWAADAQPEIRALPEPDLSRIDAMNPSTDLATAVANNYDIKYYTKKLSNVTSAYSVEETKATIQNTQNSIASALNTQYNQVLTARDTLSTAQAQLQLAQVDLNAASVKLNTGAITSTEYRSIENALSVAQSTVESSKIQLFQAMENYDWIVKGLVD